MIGETLRTVTAQAREALTGEGPTSGQGVLAAGSGEAGAGSGKGSVLATRASSEGGDGKTRTGGGLTVPTPFGQIHTDWGGSPLVVATLLLLVLAGAALIARSFRHALR